jgi:hypothetical protein
VFRYIEVYVSDIDNRKSLSSKRRYVSKSSLRKEKDPDLVRLSTRSRGREGIPSKIPAAEASGAAGASCGGRGDCGREEEDGREEGAASPLEDLRALPLVVEDRVASALCRLFA